MVYNGGIQGLLKIKKILNKYDNYHNVRHRDHRGKGLKGKTELRESSKSIIQLSKCSVVSETASNMSAQPGFEIGVLPAVSSKHIHLWLGFFSRQER